MLARISIAAALIAFSWLPGTAQAGAPSPNWAAIGLGLTPAPYGLDGNGSPMGDLAVGHPVHPRVTMVGSLTRYEFGGRTSARFTQVAVGARAYLSKDPQREGGPYLGVAPVLCHARYREAHASASWLPGVEATVGTLMPFTATLAIDWSVSRVITPDAGGFAPDPVTHSTKRDGLDRGAMRIRLVLAR